jgi:hypothetical protein
MIGFYIRRLFTLMIMLIGLGLSQVNAQEYLELIHNPKSSTTLAEIQSKAEAYFDNRDKGRGSGYKQYKRWEHHTQRFVNADGKLQNFSKLNWDLAESLDAQNNLLLLAADDWTNLGPTSYTNGTSGYNGGLGRVNVIAFHPTDSDIIYIGVPAGGLWKTTDGGTSWTPLTDSIASLGVSGIAVDHTTPSTIYILTGDGDGAQTYSVGVLKSTDSGATWSSTGLSYSVTDFKRGYKLLMHPSASGTMFAATTSGLLKTTDGWATYSTVLSGSFRDIEFKPGDPTTVYATTKDSFHKSTDTGGTWSTITLGLPTGESRSAIAVSPGDSSYVYYFAGPGGSGGSGTFKGLYRSTDSGTSFSTMSTTPNILGYDIAGSGTSDQSSYDLAIAVNPSDEENIITGGINVWRSTDGGATNSLIAYWYSPGATQYVHADIHELTYNPLDGTLYAGTDGGISKSTDDGVTWTNIWDGLEIMQFYRIVGTEGDEDLIIGGTQDNGSNKYTGTTDIEHILGGDGMDCMINYLDHDTIFYSFQFGGLQRSTDGGATSTGIQPSGSTGAWVTPYAMDATDPTIIYGGYDDVYRSTNSGTSWTNLGSDGSGALAVGIDDPARIYAAVGSVITTSSDTGSSWSTITGSWPSLTITGIAVDPADATRVWITLGGYTAGEKVYESTDAGTSWTNVSGSLPNTPALCIVYQDTGGTPMDAMYIGMGVGVYYKSDVTAWTLYNSSLPNVPIYDLDINLNTCKLRAGTFGRGLWETQLYGSVLISDVTSTAPSCPGVADGTITISASCSSCAGISYTITPTAPPGAPITQIGSGVFTGLEANSYDITVVDTGVASCTTNWDANPVVLPAGSDTVDPTALCMDITVFLDASGMATIVAGDVDAGSSDNCAIDTLALSIDTFDCSDIGAPVAVTLTATDTSGNTASCVAMVTVEDVIDPSAVCTDITVFLDASGMATIVAGDIDAGSADNCAIDTLTVSPDTFDCSDIGAPIAVTLTSTDTSGNTASCVAMVTVEDTADPTALCMDITVFLDAAGMASIVVSDVDAGSSDNCALASLTVSPDTFDCSDIGTPVAVTLTATDTSGNTSSCVAMVTVEDTIDPTVVCSDITVSLDASGTASIVAGDVDGGSSDNCAIDTLTVSPDTFDCSDIGAAVAVTLTATDTSGNTASCIAMVTVEDTISPTAACTDITIDLDASGMATIVPGDVNLGSSDNCGIDSITVSPDTFDCSDIGTPVSVTLTVTDPSGNSDSCVAIVTVEDNLEPEVICPADQTHVIDVGDLYTVPDYFATGEASATDNCTDPVSITTQDPTAGTLLDVGVHTVTITAEDAYGNSSTCTFELTIENPLGVGEYSLDNLIILHPNPARDQIIITNNSDELLTEIILYDINGKLIDRLHLSQIQKEKTIDISRYSSGVYLIRLLTQQAVVIKQLVVQ